MTLLDRIAGRRPTGDDGIALVVAIAVAGLVSILCITLVTITIAESRGSGRERQRAEAVQFAEGQVDTTLARIQAASPASLPCNGTAQSTVSEPDVIDGVTTVTYYDAAGNEVACTAAGPVAEVTSALISTTATSQALANAAPARRTVETLVNLTPTTEIDGLDKAIFGNAGVSLSNNGEVYGQDGTPDADLYTNGSFTCPNGTNQEYHGSIFAQGTITLDGTCHVKVDAWAGTGFVASHQQVLVQGDVKVGNGNAAFTAAGASVAGTVSTKGSITGNPWKTANCPAKCTEGANPGMPPQQDFPQLLWNASEWAAAEPAEGGPYTSVFVNNDCSVSGKGNGPGKWIMEKAPLLTGPTVLLTDCGVVINKNGNEIELEDNLAVFAKGGFSLTNSLDILSTDEDQPRYLYFIQPYDAVTMPCTNGISLGNLVKLEQSVNMLMYTPCNITKNNNTSHFGQMYAGGTATISNSLTMYYEPLPVWGIANEQTVLTGYTLDVVYKRENTG